jgi:predicted HicB family RNase H-like nuclease
MLTYKSYVAHVEFNDEIDIFYGEVINTRDVITFQGSSVKELKKAFKDSIEDYLEFCAKRNEPAEKPFSGKFNLRLKPELHREAYVAAKQKGKSLNNWVLEAILQHLHEKFA